MQDYSPNFGFSTLVNHAEESRDQYHAHVSPIYQTSTFSFPDVATGAAIFQDPHQGYVYTRLNNPNADLLARKIALLEGLDLMRETPEAPLDEVIYGRVFASGMAAITAAILSRAKVGDTLIAQSSIYGNTYSFLLNRAPKLGLNVVWVEDTSPGGWEQVFRQHPDAVLAFAESPANPAMLVVDLEQVAQLTHRYGAWLLVDNTFATPYCQRPLALGADVVIHSTTKYLSGHGVIIGGAVVSPHRDYVHQSLRAMAKDFGGAPSPFDAWLANMGLKTFEVRMQRHCQNAQTLARYLEGHPKVARVNYPGLENSPGHEVAKRQMDCFGGMISFELKGGFEAGETLMNSVRVITLAVSLGNVDSLISHPASMSHRSVPGAERRKLGISDGLVRFSVGIENVDDILADLDQGLEKI